MDFCLVSLFMDLNPSDQLFPSIPFPLEKNGSFFGWILTRSPVLEFRTVYDPGKNGRRVIDSSIPASVFPETL
jgi:hypothetical protein